MSEQRIAEWIANHIGQSAPENMLWGLVFLAVIAAVGCALASLFDYLDTL